MNSAAALSLPAQVAERVLELVDIVRTLICGSHYRGELWIYFDYMPFIYFACIWNAWFRIFVNKKNELVDLMENRAWFRE